MKKKKLFMIFNFLLKVKAAKLIAVGKVVAPIVLVKGAIIAKKNHIVGKSK